MREEHVNLIVIGGGPAGLSAAVAAAETGIDGVLLLDRQDELGGILPQCIHNGFGLRYFKEELTGPEYAWRFIEKLAHYPGVQIKTGAMATKLEYNPETTNKIVTVTSPCEGLTHYHTKAVILAMGCRERPRGAINIPGNRPAGIFTAGTIQRLMNIEGYRPGNQAVILGSGDIGLIMARRLTLEGIKVQGVVELLPYSSGLTRNLVQCLDDFGIPLFLSHTITHIAGLKRVAAVQIAPVDENRQPVLEKAFTMDCDTLLLSVGLIPENELSRMAGVQLDPLTGGPIVGPDYQTTVPGIFGCGNVVHVHDLVDDVTIESQIAGRAAANFCLDKSSPGTFIPLKSGRNIRAVVPQSVSIDSPTTLYIRPAFPEKNSRLWVGKDSALQRIVTPGETIRFTVNPVNGSAIESITVALEKEGETHA